MRNADRDGDLTPAEVRRLGEELRDPFHSPGLSIRAAQDLFVEFNGPKRKPTVRKGRTGCDDGR